MNFFASFMIASCFVYCGHMISKSEFEAFGQLDGLVKLLDYMLIKIQHTRQSLSSVFASFSNKALDKCLFLDTLRTSPGEDNGEKWLRACECLSVSQSVKKELFALGDTLGRVDMQTQLEQLCLCKKILAASRDAAASELGNRQKAIRTLSFLCGALIIIILY